MACDTDNEIISGRNTKMYVTHKFMQKNEIEVK